MVGLSTFLQFSSKRLDLAFSLWEGKHVMTGPQSFYSEAKCLECMKTAKAFSFRRYKSNKWRQCTAIQCRQQPAQAALTAQHCRGIGDRRCPGLALPAAPLPQRSPTHWGPCLCPGVTLLELLQWGFSVCVVPPPPKAGV